MHLVCACLNIKIGIQNFLDLDVLELDLKPEEKHHPYFAKDVYKITGKVSGITETYPCLVKSEIVGSWNICQCLICEAYTHGTNYVTGLATCSSLKEEPALLKSYGRDDNMCYSQVFKVCFPCHLDVPENVLDHLPQSDLIDGSMIQKITRQANAFLEKAEKIKVNPTISVDKQMQTLETISRRVRCEERYLQLLILQLKVSTSMLPTDNKQENVTESSHLQSHPNQCSTESDRSTLYYPESQSSLENSSEFPNDLNLKSKPVISSFTRPFESSRQKKDVTGSCPSPNPDFRSKSLDLSGAHAVGIFEMDDDADSSSLAWNTPRSPEHVSSEEDEECLAFSEEAQDRQPLGPNFLARSVPLDVPHWPRVQERYQRAVDIDNKVPKDPQEIAASMRELARSVRMTSEDVLGDLPSPLTQI